MAQQRLSPQQEKFCNEYLESGNASEAYRRAYPKSLKWKDDSVRSKASKMLSNGNIWTRISELQAKMQEEMQVTREMVAKPFIRAILSDYSNEEQLEKCIDSVVITPRGKTVTYISKKDAAEQLRRMFGLDEPEKHEVTGKDGAPVVEPIRRLSRKEAAEILKSLDDEYK